MWPLSWPIRVSQIPKSSEKLWDFIQKYFHLNSLAVYNSSAKKDDFTDVVYASTHHQTSTISKPTWEYTVSWRDIFVCIVPSYSVATLSWDDTWKRTILMEVQDQPAVTVQNTNWLRYLAWFVETCLDPKSHGLAWIVETHLSFK